MSCFDDVITCHGDHRDNAIILHMARKVEEEALQWYTSKLSHFQVMRLAVEVYENIDDNEGGRQ
jgi:hypothetical protein